jgi:hypothetical protein
VDPVSPSQQFGTHNGSGGTEGEIKIDLLDEDGQHYGRITFRTWDPKES